MSKIKKIVLTGGPCGGKTDIIGKLTEYYSGKVIIIPETATKLLSVPYEEGGIGIPGKDLEWSQEWQDRLQEMILFEQIRVEEEAIRLAQETGAEVIICDRGTLDGAAYLTGGTSEFTERFMLSEAKCLAAYDQIIHLNSLATDRPEEYERLKETNACRRENAEQARELDFKIAEAWSGHPNRHRIASTEDIEEKWQACLAALETEEEIGPEIATENNETHENTQELNNK